MYYFGSRALGWNLKKLTEGHQPSPSASSMPPKQKLSVLLHEQPELLKLGLKFVRHGILQLYRYMLYICNIYMSAIYRYIYIYLLQVYMYYNIYIYIYIYYTAIHTYIYIYIYIMYHLYIYFVVPTSCNVHWYDCHIDSTKNRLP